MRIGISFPESLKSPDHLFEWVRQVDAGPFSTLSILDRVVYSNYDPLITLAAAASISTRVRLMTEILLATIRNTTILAKETATLDVLSKGRLSLGLAVGGREDDFLATETAYNHRGKRLEEQLRQMKHIWSGQALNDNVGPIGPRPRQANGPEILLGGFSPQAIQRVGHYADGFISATNNVEQINHMFRTVEQSWQAAGRSGKPRLVAQIDIALEAQNSGQGRKNVLDYYTTLPQYLEYKLATLLTTEQQLREIIPAVEQLGADELIFFVWSPEIDQIDRVAGLIR